MKYFAVYDLAESIPPRFQSDFHRLRRNSRKAFCELIDCVSRENQKSLFWWVSNASSRNSFASRLYDDVCTILLCQQVAHETRSPTRFIVRNPAIAAVARQGLPAHCSVVARPFSGLSAAFRVLSDLKFIVLDTLRRAGSARRTRNLRPAPSGEVILFDTFVLPGTFADGSLKDRYFGRMLDLLPDSLKDQVRFLYEFYMVNDYHGATRSLRRDGRFIVAEDFLTIADYFSMLLAAARPERNIRIPNVTLDGLNFAPLLHFHVSTERFFHNSYRALLKYRLIERLQLAGLRIRLFVDWWENQWMDRAENLALQQFYPDTHRIGYYGGAGNPEFMNVYPTEAEMEASVLPDEIALIGKGWIRSFQRYTDRVPFVVWPGFRYTSVWDGLRVSHSGFSIIVALPILEVEALAILDIFREIGRELADRKDIVCRFRPHPGLPEAMRYLFDDAAFPSCFAWEATGTMSEALSCSDLLVTGWSSTCMEALASGVPVIQYHSSGIGDNIPDDVPKILWENAHDAGTMLSAIRRFHEQSRTASGAIQEEARKVRDSYFAKDTGELPAQFDFVLASDAGRLKHEG